MKQGNLSYDDRQQLKRTISIHLVVKLQSMIRGVLARRYIKRVYGFECSPGLRNRGLQEVEMDSAQLEHQRKQVLYIHQQLPQFQYGLEPNEDNYADPDEYTG